MNILIIIIIIVIIILIILFTSEALSVRPMKAFPLLADTTVWTAVFWFAVLFHDHHYNGDYDNEHDHDHDHDDVDHGKYDNCCLNR